MQELSGNDAAVMFMDSIINVDSVTYSMTSFTDGPDLDVALYYNPSIRTALHEASDHLPVVASFTYKTAGVSLHEKPVAKVMIYYSQEGLLLANSENLNLDVQIYTMDGRQVRQFYTISDHAFRLKQGMYLVVVLNQGEPVIIEKILQNLYESTQYLLQDFLGNKISGQNPFGPKASRR